METEIVEENTETESDKIEKITEERKFDTDGLKYSIQGNDLVSIDYSGEQIYQWQIQEKKMGKFI